jgi:hypothetical protein
VNALETVRLVASSAALSAPRSGILAETL